MFDLRRAEVAGLDLADVDLAGGKFLVAGKGSGGEKRPITMSPQLREAMAVWLAECGDEDGPRS